MEGGRADGQAVVWRPTPCMTQGPGYATTTSRLRDGYGTPRFGGRLVSGQRRRGPCRRRGNCDARGCRISYAASAAPSLAVTPLCTNGNSAAAGRITGPAGACSHPVARGVSVGSGKIAAVLLAVANIGGAPGASCMEVAAALAALRKVLQQVEHTRVPLGPPAPLLLQRLRPFLRGKPPPPASQHYDAGYRQDGPGAFIRRIEFDRRQVGIKYTAPIPAGEGLTTTAEAPSIRGNGTPARTRTGASGLGNRCSIRLSYRGTDTKRGSRGLARPSWHSTEDLASVQSAFGLWGSTFLECARGGPVTVASHEPSYLTQPASQLCHQ